MNLRTLPFCVIGLLTFSCSSQPNNTLPRLITGKSISTRPAVAQDVGSMPMNLLLTPDGRHVISTDMGYHQALWSIRVADGKGISHIDYLNEDTKSTAHPVAPAGEADTNPSPSRPSKTNGLYFGLAFSADTRTLYAAQGGHDSIAILHLSPEGALAESDTLYTKDRDFPAGLALDSKGLLYVSNNASAEANPYTLSGSVAIYDPHTKKQLGRYTFSDSHGGTSNFPLGITVLSNGSKTYVASERDDAVYVLNTIDPAHPSLSATLPTGSHPVAVLLSKDQHTLYVANSLSDTISVVDTATDKITSTLLLRPHMARDLPGVTPTSLALSPDQKTLYATLGDMNAVAVVDLSSSELRGYLPTGWYPSALAVTPDGKRLLIANAKGHSIRNPNNTHDRHDPKRKATSLTVLEGNVASVTIPSTKQLADLTNQVIAENHLDSLERHAPNPLASIGLSSGHITHVLYIIKENRTYDQILGDMPQGNGDPSLVLFGNNITRNQHDLASRFVLLDNLYACGEVSGDGWDWSTQGMADAYVIRNIPYQYSHRGRRFDEEGSNNGYPTGGAPATDPDGKHWRYAPFHNGAEPIPDVANTGRNLWDIVRAAHLSFRNYGCFLATDEAYVTFPGAPDNLPAAPGLQPGGHDTAGISDIDYRHFDLDYPDSDAASFYYNQTHDPACLSAEHSFGHAKAPSRFSEWNREFQMMLKKDPTGKSVPNLMMIRMPTDHTQAARSGKHAPESMVADNDFGIAQVVEAVSKSPIWPHTAIFIIEDDAQSGIDHVDAHRTTGYIISPWIKPHSVDHHFHNTDSFLKTIELLLGVPPLSQYDAVADPIMNWDTAPNNIAPYFATMPPKSLIAKINPSASALAPGDPRRSMAEASDKMDFIHADAAPAREVDEITWHLVRGPTAPLPHPHGWDSTSKDDDD
ncbi:MAG TPA: beta-propeller fold lactonase family protein [Tepidisphaeraceae bacterium]|nr:beta-propeller fold lactonase family protein [Tepidisphaeraceae bacterium]